VYSIKNTLKDEKFKDKFTAEERSTLESCVNEHITWLESHAEGTQQEYEDRKTQLESVFNPVMQRIYSQAEPGGMPGQPGTMPGQQ